MQHTSFKEDPPLTPRSLLAPYEDHARETQAPPKNIFEASERGSVGWIVKAVERTLDYDINQRDRLLRTGLHWASELGHVEVVETLLDYGCDLRLQECNGRTAIHLAARNGHLEVLKALLEEKSTEQIEFLVNQVDNYGITPVFLTLQKGDEAKPAFYFLMVCGAKYNAQYKFTSAASSDLDDSAVKADHTAVANQQAHDAAQKAQA